MIAPSQGIHLVFDRSFLAGESAIMVPHTSDGRVMFAIPWHGHTLVGTTDTPVADAPLEPVAMEQEIDFILRPRRSTSRGSPPARDILSVFAGIRPLVRSANAGNTAALSRDHTIRIENSGLLTICGGKWTTYRHMAEDCVNQAAMLARLPEKPCVTDHLNMHGFHPAAGEIRSAARVWLRRSAHSGFDARRPGARRAAPSRASLYRRGSGVGRAPRNGAHRGRCPGAPHARAVPECEGGHRHGAEGGRTDGA